MRTVREWAAPRASSNIIATLSRTTIREAIGLVSHYDSAPESPGAGDDGLGVAVALETARVIAARTDRSGRRSFSSPTAKKRA